MTDDDPKKRAVAALIAAGWTMVAAAEVVGAPPHQFLHMKRAINHAARNARMIEMYGAGNTLQEIGLEFSITRERVRQILSASGLSRFHGGACARKEGRDHQAVEGRTKRQAGALAAKNMRAWKSYGCSYETAKAINDGLPLKGVSTKTRAYHLQKSSANHRAIEWKLTLPEWWEIWDSSGMWPLRGRGKDCYCMARLGDAGAYEVGNVEIVTNVQNIQDGYAARGAGTVTRDKSLQALSMREEGRAYVDIAAALAIRVQTARQYVVLGRRLRQQVV